MRAIILAGGFGTRLASMVSDVPKPMAPVCGRPFLSYIFDYLIAQGMTSIILSVHHLHEKISNYFGDHYGQLHIDYVIEETPLGTGGAIRYAMKKCEIQEPIFVLNADSFVKLNYQKMYEQFQNQVPSMIMALFEVSDCSRHGEVSIDRNSCVQGIDYPGKSHRGFVNAGVYLLSPNIFDPFELPNVFSFENAFLVPYLSDLTIPTFSAVEYFIDIGVPAQYEQFCLEMGVDTH